MPKNYTLTLVIGDGIGPEVVNATVEVIAASGVNIQWEHAIIGQQGIHRYGVLLPIESLDAIKRNKVALKGPITTPIAEGFPSLNVALRKSLDMYANVRPVKNFPGVPSLHKNVNLVIIRENTEDLYAGIEHEVVPGVVESIKIITRVASTRIAEYAFELAVRENRKKVSAIHKANIMKLSDGLFLDCCRNVSKNYKSIQYEEMIVDNACMQLVMNPQQFDVLLMENLYGDILSDLAAGLVGGIGVVPGANIGKDYAVFEPVHGSWPQAAGKGIANPMACILTSVMMLRHLGEPEAATRIETALETTLREGKFSPQDLGGKATTQEFAKEVIKNLR
ncbi:MAG: isocitrate dehydrogenase (NAD(+)) [Dehalococcoidia bacterium]|nr:isocitrate dehydrogenase (NAD(+)) [Dehalococcoidia bacterium]